MFDELKAVNYNVQHLKEKRRVFEESSSKSRCVFRAQASIHDVNILNGLLLLLLFYI